jgi:cold shock CspA family protein
VGILLRDPETKKGLITCEFPVQGDYTNQMLWVPLDERLVEAVPIYTREKGAYLHLKNMWKSLADNFTEDHYYLVEEGGLKLKVHDSFRKHGVIEKYMPAHAYGFIGRNRRGIFFRKQWCNFEEIVEGKEVSFVPIISLRGLQARAIEELMS